MYRKSKAFTLVEMLIVISIIGIVIAGVTFSYSNALKQARDKRRISDIQTIRTALELYYHDHGQFPDIHPGANISGWNASTFPGFLSELDPYIDGPVPVDPLNMEDGVAGNNFEERPSGDYYYMYHRYIGADYAKSRGCTTIKNEIAVVGFKSFESYPPHHEAPPESERAQCGPSPCVDLDGNIWHGGAYTGTANACRDWGVEFDYSIMVKG